jgi:hypothetical protein
MCSISVCKRHDAISRTEYRAPTVFAIARRWGFTSPDGAFRDGYWATYRERPSRLSERYIAERLGIGLRALRRSFLDERSATAYVALRRLRLQEAQRRFHAQPDLTPKPSRNNAASVTTHGSAAISKPVSARRRRHFDGT